MALDMIKGAAVLWLVKKREKRYIKMYDDPINMTWTITVSKLHLCEVMSISGTWNSECIVRFLKMVCNRRSSKKEVPKISSFSFQIARLFIRRQKLSTSLQIWLSITDDCIHLSNIESFWSCYQLNQIKALTNAILEHVVCL